jgi:transcriptional regulator with XRE-family HTH domain
MGASRRDGDRASFADELRAMRKQAGLSREELADKLGYSGSTIAMVEAMHRAATRELAERLDEFFRLPGTFARLEARQRSVPFPAGFRPFTPFESQASALRLWEMVLIPGLLQTPEYARAVLSTRPNTSDDEVESLVAARLARQEVLSGEDPPLVWALMDEYVLNREVGGPEVMADQLTYLAEASKRPNITIQVVPYGAGPHSGLLGSFAIAEVNGAPSVAYLETGAEGETTEEPSMVAKVTLTWDTLRSEALPKGASREMIVRVSERWKETASPGVRAATPETPEATA